MKQLKRIEDYDKVLPIVEVYTAVQSEGSRAGYPTVVVRTTGCTHRCYFGEGGWCDSWYTSIHPEKGKYTFQSIIDMYDANPFISEMMLTGGSPSMHGALCNELTHFANERGITITIETEGSHFLETDYPIGLISLSPKFSNSVPVIGATLPNGTILDEVQGAKMIKQHNKLRLNVDAIRKTLDYHTDYHMKPVMNKDFDNWNEVVEFQQLLNIPNEKVWIMPAGDDRASLLESYGPVMNFCRDNGYKFSPRPHIIAFDTEREV